MPPRQLRRRKSLVGQNSNSEGTREANEDADYSPTKKLVKGDKNSGVLSSSRPFSRLIPKEQLLCVSTMWTTKVAHVVTITCFLWSLSYILFGGTPSGKAWFTKVARHMFQDSKGGVPIMTLAMPILISGSVCMLLLLRSPCAPLRISKKRPLPHQLPGCIERLYQYCRGGHEDWNFNNFAFIFILFPCTMFLFGCIYRHLHGKELDASDKIMEIANSFGFMAMVACSFFLIPVARHSPILNLLQWGQAHVVILHIWSGRIIFVGVALHGGMHMYRWVRYSGEGLLGMLFPPVPCYKPHTFYEPTCNDPDTDCSCYHLLRNLTGFLALVALVVIGVTSLNYVRRKFYRLFYISHVIAGPIMIITTILHYNRAILFFAPSLLYYIASSAPVLVESWKKAQKEKGVRILSVASIADSSSAQRPCISVTFEASEAAMQCYSPGQYVKLLAPSVSSIAHPFTVNTVPGKPHQLQIMFRVMGSFTSNLADQLLQNEGNSPLPVVQLDGYHGASDRLDQVLRHDVAVLVAGGIGITPFLSLVHSVYSVLSLQQDAAGTKRVVLHWMCRDASLVNFVTREYFDPLLQQAASNENKFEIRIVVHKTSHGEGEKAMPTVRSYSDLENPQQAANDELSQAEPTGTSNVVGAPFAPSRFSAGSRTRLVSNVLPFCGFAFIAWVGLAAIWYLYRNVQEKKAVASRGWAVVALFVVGTVGSFAINWLMDAIGSDNRDVAYSALPSERGAWWQWTTAASATEQQETSMDAGEATQEEIELERIRDDDAAASQQSDDSAFVADETSEDSLAKTGVTLIEEKGRPTVHVLLNSLDGARCPGLFSCGPTNLMAELRSAADVRCAMRIQHCIRGTPHISIYEEAFEM